MRSRVALPPCLPPHHRWTSLSLSSRRILYPMPSPSLYDILGVPSTASKAESRPLFKRLTKRWAADVLANPCKSTVKRAYKAMALKTHPDRVPPEQKAQAEAAFQKVSRHRFLANCSMDGCKFETNTFESHRSTPHTKCWSTIPRGRNTTRLAAFPLIQAKARTHLRMVNLVSSIRSVRQLLDLEQKASSTNISALERISILPSSPPLSSGRLIHSWTTLSSIRGPGADQGMPACLVASLETISCVTSKAC